MLYNRQGELYISMETTVRMEITVMMETSVRLETNTQVSAVFNVCHIIHASTSYTSAMFNS